MRFSIIIALLLLSACGQKGALYQQQQPLEAPASSEQAAK